MSSLPTHPSNTRGKGDICTMELIEGGMLQDEQPKSIQVVISEGRKALNQPTSEIKLMSRPGIMQALT